MASIGDMIVGAYIALGRVLAKGYEVVWRLRRQEYFDHHFDHCRGPAFMWWQERGVLGYRAIPEGGVVLDLCCGDGFYSRYYYSKRESHIDGIDVDERAIRTAKRTARYPSTFVTGDVSEIPFPRNDYDAVLFFSALHFIPEEKRDALIDKISRSIRRGGVLVGSTSLPLQREVFAPYFDSLDFWTSNWHGRLEHYFECRRG